VPGGADTDGDTVENAFDNCTTIANPSQADADHNGCGDVCQPSKDCNGDLVVGIGDVTLAAGQFGGPGACCDLDGNGVCTIGEVTVIAGNFGKPIGPSGITTAQCDPASCQCTPAP
jgi:hypothetical protein